MWRSNRVRVHDLATALADLRLPALDPDPVEVLVLQNVEDGPHVLVELFDGVLLDAVDTRPQLCQPVGELLALRLQVLAAFDRGLPLIDLVVDLVDLVFDPLDPELDPVRLAVELQRLVVAVDVDRLGVRLQLLDLLALRCDPVFQIRDPRLGRFDLGFDRVEPLLSALDLALGLADRRLLVGELLYLSADLVALVELVGAEFPESIEGRLDLIGLDLGSAGPTDRLVARGQRRRSVRQ